MQRLDWKKIDRLLDDINVKSECRKYQVSYSNFGRVLREHADMKVSNLIILADMLGLPVGDLFVEGDDK